MEPDKEVVLAKARHSATAGWLFLAAGGVDLAASFSVEQPLYAVGALCFFAAAVIYFRRAAKLKKTARG